MFECQALSSRVPVLAGVCELCLAARAVSLLLHRPLSGTGSEPLHKRRLSRITWKIYQVAYPPPSQLGTPGQSVERGWVCVGRSEERDGWYPYCNELSLVRNEKITLSQQDVLWLKV